jgi:hypothetical protein
MQMGLGQCCQHMQLHEAVTLNQSSCVSVQAVQICCARNGGALKILGERMTKVEGKFYALG